MLCLRANVAGGVDCVVVPTGAGVGGLHSIVLISGLCADLGLLWLAKNALEEASHGLQLQSLSTIPAAAVSH